MKREFTTTLRLFQKLPPATHTPYHIHIWWCNCPFRLQVRPLNMERSRSFTVRSHDTMHKETWSELLLLLPR